MADQSRLPVGYWTRSLASVAAVLGVMVLWRVAQLPAREIVVAVTLGFGIPLGSRYGTSGRMVGPGLRATLLVGVVSTGLFYALLVSNG